VTARELIARLQQGDLDVAVNFGYEGVFEEVARVERISDTSAWAGEILLLGDDGSGLTERERLVLAWNKGPEEWYAEYGGQYGAELVDAQRKRAAHKDGP
jgi:hypothetical protein